jgi:hypothetical protein
MMALVEDFFPHNYRDITARESIEWGEVEQDPDGNRSIRYMCRATIGYKEVLIINDIYTFDPQGVFVKVEKVPGYPKPEAGAPGSAVSPEKAELMGLVEDFFLNNYRDITARKSLEWGEVEQGADGNRSIRYMCRATIGDKDVLIMNEVYTFDSEGAFVKVEKVPGYPKPETGEKRDVSTKQGMMTLVEDFFAHNFRDITARETIEWGEVVKLDDGNVSIRYKYNGTIWDKEQKVFDQIFTFTPEGEFVKFVSVVDAPAATNR